MNNVCLIGRITKDPEVRYSQSGTAVCRFSIAIDRGKDKDGNDRGADFPNCIAFGKTAEAIERYFSKGRKIGITGRIQTGNYEKDGVKHYTTDVVVDRFDFCDSGNGNSSSGFTQPSGTANNSGIPEGFELVDEEDIPF